MIEDLPPGKLFKFNFIVWDEDNSSEETNLFSATKEISDIT